jgi:DNA modification methylase
MKPIPLCSKPLENSSVEGDIVLDVFLGSGSTMVASHQLKRKCYGMELDPKYCDVIVKRMIKLDPSIKVKRNGQLIDNKQWHTIE